MTMKFNQEEDEVMELILNFYGKIINWGLEANQIELTQAIHACQRFVIQHMLQRTDEEGYWSDWYFEAS